MLRTTHPIHLVRALVALMIALSLVLSIAACASSAGDTASNAQEADSDAEGDVNAASNADSDADANTGSDGDNVGNDSDAGESNSDGDNGDTADANTPAANNASNEPVDLTTIAIPGSASLTPAVCLFPPDPYEDWIVRNVTLGEGMPSITLPRLDDLSSDVALDGFAGKWCVIKFWASWCAHCKRMARDWMQPLQEEIDGRGIGEDLVLVSIGVTLNGDTAEKQQGYVETNGYEWLHLYDADNQVRNELAVRGTPAVIVIAPDGTVATYGLLETEAESESDWSERLWGFLLQSCLHTHAGE